MSPSKLDPEALPNEEHERRRVARELLDDANAARQRGELLTAMLHASDALMLYPNERDYLDLVDDIALATEDPLSLVPVAAGRVHVATAAARARILMMQRNLAEALSLLGQVVDAAPDIAYLDWARRWLQPHVLPSLGFEHCFRTVGIPSIKLALRVPVPPRPDDPRLPNVASAAEIFAALRAQFPNEAALHSAETMIRRRLGDPNRTLAVAMEGVQRFPNDWQMQTATAMAWRDAKQPERALQHARAAMNLDPRDNSPLHDAAWAYIEVSRFEEALGLFRELVQREPEYPGAMATLHYASFRAHGNEEERQALVRLRERQPWDDDAQRLANEVDPPEPYFNVLPGSGEATAAGARKLVRELAAVFRCCGRGARVAFDLVSEYAESPSVALAFDVAIRGSGGDGATLNVQVERLQTPDPRADKAQVAFRIWGFDGCRGVRQPPPADPQIQQAVAYVADQLFRFEIWDAAAGQVAAHFGPGAGQAFLSALTDPPLPPLHGEFDGFIWTYRCQVATALVLSHLGPWEGGPGRTALYSLAYGPTDWTTNAALIAMAWRARANPALRPEVESVFQWMRSQLPAEGFTCWESPLCHLWLGLGPHPDPVRQALEQWRDEYAATVHLKNRARRPERRFAGLTMRQYAEFCMERDRVLGARTPEELSAKMQAAIMQPPQALVELCQRYGVNPIHPEDGRFYPYVWEWMEAMNANPELHEEFVELERNLKLEMQGVSGDERRALDQIREGGMDMHLRMAQQQQAQRAVAEGQAGEPDPVVFPGQPLARLSDYVGMMRRMQSGDMMGALATYGLDMMSYGAVATAWGAKLAADPILTEKFNRMMAS